MASEDRVPKVGDLFDLWRVAPVLLYSEQMSEYIKILSEKRSHFYFVSHNWRKVCFFLEDKEDCTSSTGDFSDSVKEETDVGTGSERALEEI